MKHVMMALAMAGAAMGAAADAAADGRAACPQAAAENGRDGARPSRERRVGDNAPYQAAAENGRDGARPSRERRVGDNAPYQAAAENGRDGARPSQAEEEYISVVTGKPVPKDGKYTVEQIKARDERVLKKTGGFIHQAAEGPEALLVDARAKPRLTLDEVARVYGLATHLRANVEKEPRGDASPLEFAKRKMSERKPLMLVMVVEGLPEQPILSVFPEERVAYVNADRLRGGDDPSAPEMRVSKEVWRAIGFVGGIGFSQADNDIMQPLYSLKELDANRYPFIQPMNMAKMQKMWKRFGVKKERRIPYRVAVQEGWAAKPTNDYQRAVWNEVRQLPEKPVKIEFDPKKGK